MEERVELLCLSMARIIGAIFMKLGRAPTTKIHLVILFCDILCIKERVQSVFPFSVFHSVFSICQDIIQFPATLKHPTRLPFWNTGCQFMIREIFCYHSACPYEGITTNYCTSDNGGILFDQSGPSLIHFADFLLSVYMDLVQNCFGFDRGSILLVIINKNSLVWRRYVPDLPL